MQIFCTLAIGKFLIVTNKIADIKFLFAGKYYISSLFKQGSCSNPGDIKQSNKVS